jgi:hypothetical protein
MKFFGNGAIPIAVLAVLGAGSALPQSNSSGQQESSPKETQPKHKAKKDKNQSKSKAKSAQQSDTPMSEKPPTTLPQDRTRPNPPTLPPHTPGEQPAPQSADPTKPTTTQPK